MKPSSEPKQDTKQDTKQVVSSNPNSTFSSHSHGMMKLCSCDDVMWLRDAMNGGSKSSPSSDSKSTTEEKSPRFAHIPGMIGL